MTRWHPAARRSGKRGWSRIIDTGSLAVWMRPESRGGVTIALYAANYFDDSGHAHIWLVQVPRCSDLPFEIVDKPRRIKWANADEECHCDHSHDFCTHATWIITWLTQSSHGRHNRRLNWNRHIWKTRLPRKVLAALRPLPMRRPEKTMAVLVDHAPQWEPTELQVDAEGNTRPGFICVHELENGNGQCGGNTFDPDSHPHSCVVEVGKKGKA